MTPFHSLILFIYQLLAKYHIFLFQLFVNWGQNAIRLLDSELKSRLKQFRENVCPLVFFTQMSDGLCDSIGMLTVLHISEQNINTFLLYTH